MIAEDDYELQQMERRILEGVGLSVTIADNGKKAVALATEHPYDLILMDMQMPEMDGITATRTLRSAGLETPVVALTANVMQQHQDEFERVGVTHFLSKPINLDKLHTVLDRFLEKTAPAVLGEESQSPRSDANPLGDMINSLLGE